MAPPFGLTMKIGSAPRPRWGLHPQTPVIGSRSARSPWPPLCQILNTPLKTHEALHVLARKNVKVESAKQGDI